MAIFPCRLACGICHSGGQPPISRMETTQGLLMATESILSLDMNWLLASDTEDMQCVCVAVRGKRDREDNL